MVTEACPGIALRGDLGALRHTCLKEWSRGVLISIAMDMGQRHIHEYFRVTVHICTEIFESVAMAYTYVRREQRVLSSERGNGFSLRQFNNGTNAETWT